MQIEINAISRESQGTGASRRMRVEGRLPGVIYGGNGDAQSIELGHKDLFYKLKTEAFHASILSINIDGRKEQVLLRNIQMHPFRQQVLHVDFQRVRQDQKIYMKVPLHFINADIAPGVKLSGGTVSHVVTEVEISCFPKDLPEFIRVDLSEMTVGSTLHLSDLKLPENVEVPTLLRGDNQPISTLVVQREKAADEIDTDTDTDTDSEPG